MTPAQWLRDIEAAKAAQRQYARAYDRLAEEAQLHLGAGHHLMARKTARQASLAMRAWQAEWMDPDATHPR